MDDTIEQRLAALERALTDDDYDLAALAAEGESAQRLRTVEDDLDSLQERVADLEAATQALRGYVGNVRAVNEDVRERADLALETAEQAEQAVTAETAAAATSADASASDTDSSESTDSPQHHDEEPTLELAGEDHSARHPQSESSSTDHSTASSHTIPSTTDAAVPSSTDRCPLCEGDTEDGRGSERERRVGHENTPDRDSHHLKTYENRQSVPDGGLVPTDEDSDDETDAAVLSRIRALL